MNEKFESETTDSFAKDRLESDILYSIAKFDRYAKMHPIDRNNFIVFILEQILEESKKRQLE